MTDQTPPASPVPPAPQVPNAPLPPKPPKQVGLLQALLVGGLAVLLAAVLSVSITLAVSGDDVDKGASPRATSSQSPDDSSEDDFDVADDEPLIDEPVELDPSDFALKVKTREKQCFGSAGCALRYQVDPSYLGLEDVSVGSWDITYQVTGPEDGPTINTMTLEDGTFSFDEEETASTPSSSTKLKAKVISVENTDY